MVVRRRDFDPRRARGSVYAAVRASRWWFALTVVEALMVLVLVLALGG
jgi:hypothetical protein